MKKPGNRKEDFDFTKLRQDAEKFLNEHIHDASLPDKDIKMLFQELQVHQIELEMQNDELRLINVELERQRIRFSGIYDFAPIGYFLLDRAGIIKEVNNTGMTLLEATKKDISGKRMQSYVAPEDYDAYYSFFMQMLRTHTHQRCELNIRAVQGHKFNAQVEGIALNTSEGNIECYIALVDISERIRAQKELADVKERLELAMKASSAGTWELNLTSMRFFMDESSQRICNMPKGTFYRDYTDFINMIHVDDKKEADRQFHLSLVTGKEIDIICRFGTPNQKECYTVIRGHKILSSKTDERLVGIIMDITEKMLMEKNSRLLKMEHQKKIAIATLHTEENERKRISGALHDSVSQLLYAVKIKLGQMENKPNRTEILGINKLLEEAIAETRNISFELAPSILTDFGLVATLEELVQRLSSKTLKITTNIKGFFKRMDLLLETNIYRIIQELLNNSMRHGEATEIDIELKNNEVIEIIIRDNGKGFNVQEQERRSHGSGLFSIKNRLSLYNGNMQIESEPGKGTTVSVKLNIKDQV